MLGYFMSILLFLTPLHHQYGRCSKYCWCILTICIYGRYLGVETMVQFLFLLLWQPISEWYFSAWKYMTCWPKCNVCVLEARLRKVGVRDHDPWFIPYGYRDGWLGGILIVVHWRIGEIKMIQIRITLVKWWWTTRDGRKQTQCHVDVCAPAPSDVVLCNPFK